MPTPLSEGGNERFPRAISGMSVLSISCRICKGSSSHLFEGRLLNYRIQYFECVNCGYVQTEEPFWLGEAYHEAINRSDTGILRRNGRNARRVICTLMMIGKLEGVVIDCAGGYGILVRMLRDRGVNALWSDPYCDNLVARGFEADNTARADLVTAFEALEHFVDPLAELSSLLARSDFVLTTTDLIPTPAPLPGTWWYYAPEHGQHIGFFRIQTLRWMAKTLGCELTSDGKSLHLFSKHSVPAWRWQLFKKGSRVAELIARFRLESLVWPDSQKMSALRLRTGKNSQ